MGRVDEQVEPWGIISVKAQDGDHCGRCLMLMDHISLIPKHLIPGYACLPSCQDVDYELPMQPITMMRNALGKEEGGSGVPLSREKYDEAVRFWTANAPIK